MLQFYRRLSESGEWGQEGAGQGAESDVERLHRTSSISEIEIDERSKESHVEPAVFISQSRSNTYTDGDIKKKCHSDGNLLLLLPPSHSDSLPPGGRGKERCHSMGPREMVGERERELELMTFSSPRHFHRRGGVVDGIGGSRIKRMQSEDTAVVKIVVEEKKGGRQITERVVADSKPLREVLDYLFIKYDLEVDWDPPTHYFTVITRKGTRTSPDLDLPTQHFTGNSVEIRPLVTEEATIKFPEEKLTFTTLKSCLAYFTTHGLVELPLPNTHDEEDYHLPRVQPLDHIPETWEDLPISSEYKKGLSAKEMSQQQAIWELIYTEHSHLRQMGVIINLFMQCLELIRRANIMSRENYHNVFGGYMEELYTAHEQFWSWTLFPCLEHSLTSKQPLDVSIIIQRFPEFSTHFEIYEQHCALDAVNLRNLNKAMKNDDFRTYLEWCEAHPECQRRKLKDFLVIPMQRLTKYPLLFNAILKETTDHTHHQQLEKIWHEADGFVKSVNTVLLAQSETERVRDAMSRVTSYTAVDVPHEYREVIQPYTHLDLLAPMPDVEIDKPRVLMLEGGLKYRDHSTRMVAHIFLFTDMILITKAKRGGDKFTVERPPYQINNLVLHSLEPGTFLVIVLSRYRVLTTWFTLKAVTEAIATEWMQAISHAQSCYTQSMEKKEHHWKILQSLKSERILNGIENRSSVGMGRLAMRHSLSPSIGSHTTSNESLDHTPSRPRPIPSIELHTLHGFPMRRSNSGESRHRRYYSNPSLNGTSDFPMGQSDSMSQSLEKTSSLRTLFERPESNYTSPSESIAQLLSPRTRSHSMDQSCSNIPSSVLSHVVQTSPDSSQSDDMNIHEVGDEIGLLPTATVAVENQHEDGSDKSVVMVTPPIPQTPTSSLSPIKKESQMKVDTNPTHKKPDKTSRASPTYKNPLANIKNAIQTAYNKHSTTKPSSTHNQTSHTQKGNEETSKRSGFEALSMLGGATLSILASINPSTNTSSYQEEGEREREREGEREREREGEREREREGEKEEIIVHSTSHTIIPTSSGSDTESMSSSPRIQVVECINDLQLEQVTKNEDKAFTEQGHDLNLKSDIPSITESVTIFIEEQDMTDEENEEKIEKVVLQSTVDLMTSTNDITISDDEEPTQTIPINLPTLTPHNLITPPKLNLPVPKKSHIEMLKSESLSRLQRRPSRNAERGVRELSRLFEGQDKGQALETPSLSCVVKKSKSTAGSSQRHTNLHDNSYHDNSCLGNKDDTDGNGIRKSLSTPKLNERGDYNSTDVSRMDRLTLTPSPQTNTHEITLNNKFKGQSRDTRRDKRGSLDDLLISPSRTPSPILSPTAIRNIIVPIETRTDNYLLPHTLQVKQSKKNYDSATRSRVMHGQNQTTDRPNKATERPNKATDRPNRTTERQNKATDRANITTDRPNKATERPNRTTDRPNKATERPNKATERPNRITERPNKATERPNRTTDRPNKATERPNKATERPNRITERPNNHILNNGEPYRNKTANNKMNHNLPIIDHTVTHHTGPHHTGPMMTKHNQNSPTTTAATDHPVQTIAAMFGGTTTPITRSPQSPSIKHTTTTTKDHISHTTHSTPSSSSSTPLICDRERQSRATDVITGALKRKEMTGGSREGDKITNGGPLKGGDKIMNGGPRSDKILNGGSTNHLSPGGMEGVRRAGDRSIQRGRSVNKDCKPPARNIIISKSHDMSRDHIPMSHDSTDKLNSQLSWKPNTSPKLIRKMYENGAMRGGEDDDHLPGTTKDKYGILRTMC